MCQLSNSDHLGSTRLVLDENNQVISNYKYDAFGNTCPVKYEVYFSGKMEGTQRGGDLNYQYTGQDCVRQLTEYEDELDLHNFRARFYDSDLMRFYAVDPVEEFDSPYLYCGNSPIIFVDPDGKASRGGTAMEEDEKSRQQDQQQEGNWFARLFHTGKNFYTTRFAQKKEENKESEEEIKMRKIIVEVVEKQTKAKIKKELKKNTEKLIKMLEQKNPQFNTIYKGGKFVKFVSEHQIVNFVKELGELPKKAIEIDDESGNIYSGSYYSEGMKPDSLIYKNKNNRAKEIQEYFKGFSGW